MNIFSVLSTGKSNLHEPSMSAMLAYLLNPNQDHGVGNKFLNGFLTLANNDAGIYSEYIESDSFKFEIDLEVSYRSGGKRNDIDIQIKILDSSYKEKHRIIVENKIKSQSSNPEQLRQYYEAVLSDKENDDVFELPPENLSVIFLTPMLEHKGLKDEFSNLTLENKVWIYWSSDSSAITTVVTLIQNILDLEQKAMISPINEYMRHTLKAFTYYIIKTIDVTTGKSKAGEDLGELKQSGVIDIGGLSYTLILRDSGQIQLLDSSGDKVQARSLLRKFLKENNVEEKENCLTTRCFGSQIFKYLDSTKTKI